MRAITQLPAREDLMSDTTISLFISTWNQIREQFTEVEKDKLNAAICGEIICPPCVALDVAKLGAELAQKIEAAKEGRRRR